MLRAGPIGRHFPKVHFRKDLEAFSQAFGGMPIRIADLKGKELWQSRRFKSKGLFCLLAGQKKSFHSCHSSQQKAVREAIRWGVPTIGHCCFSILQIVAPLMDSGRLVGSLMAGPFLIDGPFDLASKELPMIQKKLQVHPPKLKKALMQIPVIEEEKVTKASQNLFHLANELSIPDLSCLAKVREIQELQDKVAEEIQSLKTINPDLTPSQLFRLSYEAENEIISRVCGGEQGKAKEILHRLLAVILSQYLHDLNLLKVALLELIVVISRAAVEAGGKADDILGWKYQRVSELWQLQNQEELCFWTVRAVDNIIESISRSRNQKIDTRLNRALQFIDQQACLNPKIAAAAREVCLSPSRFSHLFSKEMGFPYVKYLTKVRIEKARTLLRDPGKSIADVTQETGFFDQSYFTKVFKKAEGTTPKAFRKALFRKP